MNATRALRAAAALGVALATTVATWWLAATRLALEQGGDSARVAATALLAMALARGLTLAAFSPRAGAVRSWRAGAVEGLALITASWPVVVLATSASRVAVLDVVRGETLLLTGALVLPALGSALRRACRAPDAALLVATLAGIALAALLWATRNAGWLVPGPGGVGA